MNEKKPLGKRTSIEISKVINQNAEWAFELLTNPLNLPEIHPLIDKVIIRDGTKFICHETSKVFFIPYRFNYDVTVTKTDAHVMVMESEVQKGVFIKLTFSLAHDNGQNVLSEKIEVYGPLVIRKLLISKMKSVHVKMLENLEKMAIQMAAVYSFLQFF